MSDVSAINNNLSYFPLSSPQTALVITLLAGSAIAAGLAYFHFNQGIVSYALYGGAGGLAAIDVALFIALVICGKKQQVASQPQEAKAESPEKVVSQPPKAAQEPKIAKNSASEALALEIQKVKNEAFTFIESLGNEVRERNADFKVFDRWHKEEDDYYSKEELREDFELTVQKYDLTTKKGQQDALKHITLMRDALPYHFSQKVETVSSYKPVGIPNYHGNNCYMNAALQVLAHTHISDYALLRPVRPPAKVENPGPRPAKPQMRKVVLQEADPSAPFEEYLKLSRLYDDEKEQAKKEYGEALAIYHSHYDKQLAFETYQNDLKGFEENCAIQKHFWYLIIKLRSGTKPSEEDINNFHRLLGGQGGNQGDVSDILGLLHFFAKSNYVLKTTFLVKEALEEKKCLDAIPWVICVLGGRGHYIVYVNTTKGRSVINDGSVSSSAPSNQKIVENRASFGPHLPLTPLQQVAYGSTLVNIGAGYS